MKRFDEGDWGDTDPVLVDHIASLLGLMAKTTTALIGAVDKFHGLVADATPAPTGQSWDESQGTASRLGEDSGGQDAEIVWRLRQRCSDNRYDRSSDAELLQLFKRNRQVLGRSDEDVIAAMTHQK